MFTPRARLLTLDEFELEAGLDAIELLSGIDFFAPLDKVVATGSIIDGFSNAGSDIDVMVMRPMTERTSVRKFHVRLKRWIDVDVVPVTLLESTIMRMRRAASVPDAWGWQVVLGFREIMLLHRALISIPLTTEYRQFGTAYTPDSSTFQRAAANYHLYTARNLWHDSAGAHLSGQYVQAAYTANLGLERCLDAWAAVQGETNPNDKWRLAKWARIASDPLRLSDILALGRPPREDFRGELLGELGRKIYALMYYLARQQIPEPDYTLPPTSRWELLHGENVTVNAYSIIESSM